MKFKFLKNKQMHPKFGCKNSIGAWSVTYLQGYDVPSCAYYMRKKLPIVAYATVQMQSNAIQVAGGASPASPTSPTTPVSPPPPAASSPATPLQPFPEPPTTIVTPAPVVAIAPTPAEPTPDQPIACEAASAAGNTQVLMGPMTQQQTMVWQQAIVQKQLQAAQQIKPQATILLPGPVPLPIPAPITIGPKPIPVDPTDPRGPIYTPSPTLPTFPIITPPISILPIVVGIINICIPKSQQCAKQCTPPAGEKFNYVTHWASHSAVADPEKGSHGCEVKTGSPVHWHYSVNNQSPYPDCACNTALHKFGGCGSAPQ